MHSHPIGSQDAPANLLIFRVLWVCMIFSAFLAVVLCYAPTADNDSPYSQPPPMDEHSRHVLLVCIVLSALALALSATLPQGWARWLGQRNLRNGLTLPQSIGELVDWTTWPLITQMILTEFVLIFGLVAVLSAQTPYLILGFAAAATLFMVLQFPTDRRLHRFIGSARFRR